jgi:UDPglucose 6-dehydrogenase
MESDLKIKRVSVVGLGKLGSPIVACFASKGYSAIGLDVLPASVQALKEHRAPVSETGLQDLITANAERISGTSDWNEAIMGSDASFIVVPTPSNPDGAFTSKYVVDAVEHIGEVLKNKKDFHLVSVVSTVMPGSSEKEIIPALERTSGKKAGKDFGYVYSPTLIALGSVVRDFMNPELVMIGESDPRSGAMLEEVYATVFNSKPTFHHVKPMEAELAKISLNTFITTKISFANMLGSIADKMGGREVVNVDNVTKILGSDSRVGSKYLKAGGSYGGPCFPRDNRALVRAAELAGAKTYIPQATDQTNRDFIEDLAQKAELHLSKNPQARVAVMGLSYKLNTEVVEEAMGLNLAKRLAEKNVSVIVYDPVALVAARKVLGDTVQYADTAEDCIAHADVVVIANPYQFDAIQTDLLKGKPVIDCWRVLRSA